MRHEIWEDLRFFVESLSSLSVSRSMRLGSGLCVSVGSYAENWVYFPERVERQELVVEAVKFFAGHDETFMWPLYDGGAELLASVGLLYAGDLTAMSLEPEDARPSRINPEVSCQRVRDGASVNEWALTGWRAFGGGEDVPKEYCDFVAALGRESKNVALYLARVEGVAVGTFALTDGAESLGVYYLGTSPEMRHRGIAASMMNEICRIAGNRLIVLQSTPDGLEFYRNFGFNELFRIPAYSTDPEIL